MRLIGLDILRGISILMVVVYHYLYYYDLKYGHAFNFPIFFSYGYLGINVFFIISGYVIFREIDRIKTAKEFFWKRFSRLYPSYWLSAIIIFSTVSLFGLPGREINLRQLMVNLTMFQHWLAIPDVDGIYWILPIILTFYSLVFLTLKMNLKKYWGVIGLSLNTLGILIWQLPLPWQASLQTIFIYLRYHHLFFGGTLLYRLSKESNRKNILMVGFCLFTQLILFKPSEFLITVIFFVCVYLIGADRLKLRGMFLAYLGMISYQLYLIHGNIGYVIMRQMYRLTDNYWLILAIPLLASLVLASAIYYFVELPSKKFLRHLLKIN